MMRYRPFRGGYPSWIEVAGFKSIRDPARIDIRPLTLLAGTNSSGKSSVFQPLLLLKQSMEVSYDPDPLLLDGPHVAFTSLNQFLSRGRTKDSQGKEFHVAFGPMVLPPRSRERESLSIDVKLTFARTSPRDDRLKVKTSIQPSGTSQWIEVSYRSMNRLRRLIGIDESDGDLHIYTGHLRAYVELFESTNKTKRKKLKRLPIIAPLDWVGTIFHLPGHRGYRERRYPITKVTRDESGDFSVSGPMPPYAASLLRDWEQIAKNDDTPSVLRKKAEKSLEEVNKGLKSLGLTWKVHSKSAEASKIELRVGRLPVSQQGGAQDLVDIADVGFGVSEALPVLVGLAAAAPGQMVLIEQPELHLHPHAQLAMGRVLAEAARRGVIVVVETHSPLILRAIQTVVAKGRLTPDQVGLHWFSRDGKTGWSTVTRADLHRDGTFGDWPVDFPDVFAMADQEFIDAVFAAGGAA